MMKKLLGVLLLLVCLGKIARAQNPTYTPNLNLELPPRGFANWDTVLNSNFTIIDAAVGARLTVTGAITVGHCAGFASATQVQDVGPCGGSGSTIFTSFQFGSNTAITGAANYIQVTGSALFNLAQSGAGSSGSPYVDTINLASQTANCVIASPNGSSGVPTCRALVAADIPSLSYVTSVGLTVPSWLSVAGSPVNSSGTLAVSAATAQTPHQVIGTCGAATSFAPCSLVAGDLPSSVVTSVSNDTNVTGSISGQVLTLGWTGTLAAGRLNANVVQGVANDTNVTGSIAAQVLTFAWSGTLAGSRGGWGQALPTPTRAGDLFYYNGTTWTTLGGNNSGTGCLQETSSGVPSWAACGGAGTAFQANAIALTSSSTVNFENSSAFNGLTVTFANPSAGNVQLGLSGTLGNAGLTNSSTTVSGVSCTLGSGCTVPYSGVSGTPTLEYQTVQSNGSAVTQRATVNFISGSNATFSCVDNSGASRTDCTISASAAAGSRLDQLTAATGSNSINSADNAQVWNWSLSTASKTAFLISENLASTAIGTPVLFRVTTVASSTANPFQADSNGNGLRMSTAGLLAKIGTGGLDFASLLNFPSLCATHNWSTGASASSDNCTQPAIMDLQAGTSANLASIISDETGTGVVVFSSSPTIVTPTIASFVNATHNHTNAAGGGQLTDAALSSQVTVPKGGSGATTEAAHGVLLGEGTSAFVSAVPSGNAQCFMSAASSGTTTDPSFQSCPTGFSNPMTTLGDLIYENATPAAARLAGPTAQNIPYILTLTPSGGVAQAPTWSLPGIPFDAQVGTSYTIANADREELVTTSNASAIAITLPKSGSGNFTNNFAFALANIGAGLVTITPGTSTINGSATQIVPDHWISYVYGDNTNYRAGTFADIAAYVDCHGTSSAEQFTASTGVFGCITNIATTTNGGPISGTAPVAVSAGGAISITGAAGQVLAGASPAFTATPTLGVNTSVTGQVGLANGGAGGATVVIQNSSATVAYNFNLPASAGSANAPLLSGGGGSTAQSYSTILYLTSLNSGGIIYGSTTTQLATSATLASNALVLGGGSGTAPFSGDVQDVSNALFSASGNTQAVTYRGGQDASANAVLGGVVLRGANQTGAGGATSQGGYAFIEGGSNIATNAGSQGGSVELLPGASTGVSTPGLQGLLITNTVYVKGATVTHWNLECESAAMTVTDCAASPTNWLGVAELVNSNTVQVSVAPSEIPINASAAVTLGHTVCAGSTAGEVTDSGGTATCGNSQGSTVGVVVATSGAWTLADGTTFSASTTLPLIQMNTASLINSSGGGSGTVNNCSTAGAIAYYAGTGTTVSCAAGLIENSSGAFTAYDGLSLVNLGIPADLGTSDVTAQSSSQSTVTLLSGPTAGHYFVKYYADQSATCTTGANSVSFTFNWTDGSNARSLTTGNLPLGSSQATSNYLEGSFDIWVGSSNVTYTSTVSGACGSGTSSYDIHAEALRTK